MTDLVVLSGSVGMDAKRVLDTADHDPYYVVNALSTDLYRYIEDLGRAGVPDRVLSRVRICGNLPLGERVVCRRGEHTVRPGNLLELLFCLESGAQVQVADPQGGSALQNDLMQQLIYLGCPLQPFSAAAGEVSGLQQRGKSGKAAYGPKSIGVFASHKSGKSTTVNSLIGQELMPVGMDVSVPVTCRCGPGLDGEYSMRSGQESVRFPSAEMLNEHLVRTFAVAECAEQAPAGEPVVDVVYARADPESLFSVISDTPAPDAAHADRRESIRAAWESCDLALFVLDYAKHLTATEMQYLQSIQEEMARGRGPARLLVALNKMDVCLQGKQAKSAVMSVDFVRQALKRRLPQTDSAGICLFPLAARICRYAQELPRLAAKYPWLAVLLAPGTDLSAVLPKVLQERADQLPDEDLNVLCGLNDYVGRLRRQLRFPAVSLELVYRQSGIPRLRQAIAAALSFS